MITKLQEYIECDKLYRKFASDLDYLIVFTPYRLSRDKIEEYKTKYAKLEGLIAGYKFRRDEIEFDDRAEVIND